VEQGANEKVTTGIETIIYKIQNPPDSHAEFIQNSSLEFNSYTGIPLILFVFIFTMDQGSTIAIN
jgi:hypothetical protein